MDTIQNIIFAVVGIIYLIYSALKESKKGKTGPPAAGETPVLPKEDIPSLEDLLRGRGRKDGTAKSDTKERAKGTVRRMPGQARPRTTTMPPVPVPAPPQGTSPEPFTTAQNHTFERRPSYERLEQSEVNYEQLEQSDTSYEQAPSADQLAPGLERVPYYANEAAGEVDYEDPKRAAYGGLDSRKPRFEPFEPERQRVSPYARLLRNPQSAREAFILTEIFRRKY
jgi:hypothetical protein